MCVLNKRIIISVITVCLCLFAANSAFAVDFTGDEVQPGLSNIQPNDTITFPENTTWATLTATWGKKEAIPESPNTADESHILLWSILALVSIASIIGLIVSNKRRAKPAKSDKKLFALLLALVLVAANCVSAPTYALHTYTMDFYPGTEDEVTNLPESQIDLGSDMAYNVPDIIPEREGYEFIGWILDYCVSYGVTYIVNPDPHYGTPEGSTVPTDPKQYTPGETVDVADQLTTTVDYAYNYESEKISGVWEFVPWNKDDFPITEDTTITGEWTFTRNYRYIVHYVIYEGSVESMRKVNIDTSGTVTALGTNVEIDAIPVEKLSAKSYRSPKKYRIRRGFEHVTATITRDNYEIWIVYERIPTTS